MHNDSHWLYWRPKRTKIHMYSATGLQRECKHKTGQMENERDSENLASFKQNNKMESEWEGEQENGRVVIGKERHGEG